MTPDADLDVARLTPSPPVTAPAAAEAIRACFALSGELTRLPGEADAAQVLQVLQLGMASGRPVQAVLADARAGKPLTPSEWRLLAFYSWDTDEDALVPAAERGQVLTKLAASCPASEEEAGTRLLLKSIAGTEGGAPATADAAARADLRTQLLAPLASLRPGTADKLADTLRAWLLHQGRRDDVAAALFVHPQTVRYRMGQLRELYGDRLEDPETVLALTVALG